MYSAGMCTFVFIQVLKWTLARGPPRNRDTRIYVEGIVSGAESKASIPGTPHN